MKLSEVKTYVLGVLRGAFKNKDIIDKLSVNERKDLTYDGLPVNGKHNCYRQEEILWEGNNKTLNSIVTLSNAYTDYDELIFTLAVNGNSPTIQWTNHSVFTEDLTINVNHKATLSCYYTRHINIMAISNTEIKITEIQGDALPVLLRVKGIKYTAIPDTIKAVEYYDTEEQVVGRWVDGKPVYRKVFIATKTTTGETSYPINTVLGLNSVKDFHLINENIAQFDAPNNFGGSGYFFAANVDYLGCYWNAATNSFVVRGGTSWPKVPFTFCYIAEYTKSADAADSFSPDLIHNPLTKYSTDETRIGEWIDGKPIYKKVVVFTPTSRDYEYPHGIPIDTPISCKSIYNLIGKNSINTETAYPSNSVYGSVSWLNKTNIRVNIGSSLSAIPQVTAMIEYTKTTD